jgi:hypothetical protein
VCTAEVFKIANKVPWHRLFHEAYPTTLRTSRVRAYFHWQFDSTHRSESIYNQAIREWCMSCRTNTKRELPREHLAEGYTPSACFAIPTRTLKRLPCYYIALDNTIIWSEFPRQNRAYVGARSLAFDSSSRILIHYDRTYVML